MATDQPSTISSKTPRAICSVCKETLDPMVAKKLACSHVYCESCLDFLLLSGQTVDLTRQCPQCEKAEKKASAPATSAAPAPAAQPDRAPELAPLLSNPCDECQATSAVCWCAICKAKLCGTCDESLHAARVHSRHKRVALAEVFDA